MESYASTVLKALRKEYGGGWDLLTRRQQEAEMARRFMLDLMGMPQSVLDEHPVLVQYRDRAREFYTLVNPED